MRSHQGRLKPKLLLVSGTATEWCTRCMSGVTTIQRNMRSSRSGTRTLPWLNIEVALSTTSNSRTASAVAPSAAQNANQDGVENDDPQVARPAQRAFGRLVPPRRKQFPRRHEHEDAGECREPDRHLKCQHRIGQSS